MSPSPTPLFNFASIATKLFSDYVSFTVTALGLSEDQRTLETYWKSEPIRIYSQDCKEVKNLKALKVGCQFEDYGFGPGQNSQIETIHNLTDIQKCYAECTKKNCVTYSWDKNLKICEISSSTDNDFYFCPKPNSLVVRSKIVCKKASQFKSLVDKYTYWCVRKSTWLKDPSSTKTITGYLESDP